MHLALYEPDIPQNAGALIRLGACLGVPVDIIEPCGFLFTDAGVVTAYVSNEEVRKRSVHGYTQFVAAGWNERMLESVGFRLLETENRTASVLKNASGRLAAVKAHRLELERVTSAADFASQQDYLETVVELSRIHLMNASLSSLPFCPPAGW